jgi:hypothetical protein
MQLESGASPEMINDTSIGWTSGLCAELSTRRLSLLWGVGGQLAARQRGVR